MRLHEKICLQSILAQIFALLIFSGCETVDPQDEDCDSNLVDQSAFVMILYNSEFLPTDSITAALTLRKISIDSSTAIGDSHSMENISIKEGWGVILYPDTLESGEWEVEVSFHLGTRDMELVCTDTLLVDDTGSDIIFVLENYPKFVEVLEDFEDVSYLPYGGPAYYDVLDGVLRIHGVPDATVWIWHIFTDKYDSLGVGTIRFDIFLGEGWYYFDFRGHPIDPGPVDWGPSFHFNQGVVEVTKFIEGEYSRDNTGFFYETNSWYQCRVDFDIHLGEKGTYDLFLKLKDDLSEEQFVGTYDFEARGGKFYALNQYSLSIKSTDTSSPEILLIDNINLFIK